MKILSIQIIRFKYSTDKIYLNTDLPGCVIDDEGTVEAASFKASIPRGSGEEFCAKYFPGIPVEVINAEQL